MNFVPNSAAGAPADPLARRISLAEALGSACDTKVLRVGPGVLDAVPQVFASGFPGKKGVVISDAASFSAAGQRVSHLLQAAGLEATSPFIYPERPLPAEH